MIEKISINDMIVYKTYDGKFHRDDGPAIEYADGSKFWYKNGKLHRTDGPAIEYPNGTVVWYNNGLVHRDGGPAWQGDLFQIWHSFGDKHREDGPAAIYTNKSIYYLHNYEIDERIFLALSGDASLIDGNFINFIKYVRGESCKRFKLKRIVEEKIIVNNLQDRIEKLYLLI